MNRKKQGRDEPTTADSFRSQQKNSQKTETKVTIILILTTLLLILGLNYLVTGAFP